MYFLFVDDSTQTSSRKSYTGFTSLCGVIVHGSYLNSIIKEIENEISLTDLPQDEELKWSPNRDSFLYKKFHDPERSDLYKKIFNNEAAHEIKAIAICQLKAHIQHYWMKLSRSP